MGFANLHEKKNEGEEKNNLRDERAQKSIDAIQKPVSHCDKNTCLGIFNACFNVSSFHSLYYYFFFHKAIQYSRQKV